MRFLIVAAVVLLSACGTTHKVVHTDQKRSDSSAVVNKDSSYKSVQAEHTQDFTAKNVDITVWYDTSRPYYPADSALAAAIGKPVDRSPRKAEQYVTAIKNAISAGGRAAKIEIHIGSVSDTETQSVRIDTGRTQTASNIGVTKTEKKVDKDVTHSGWPWYAWLAVILLAALLIAGILKRFGLL